MVNWMDPMTMLAQSVIFAKILIGVLGLYSWEIVVTLWYDMSVITRQRAFKWPMIAYWLCKYTMFFAAIGLVVATNVTTHINCQGLYTFNQLMGNFTIGAASTLLMIRTIAIWSQNLKVVVPLLVLSATQWGILLHSVTNLKVNWMVIGGQGQCVVTAAPAVFLKLLYIFTMSFDFLVLILSTVGLIRMPGRGGSGRSGLWSLLVRDGLFYFIVAFTSNFAAVVLILLNLNPVMNIIATVPAAAITSSVACRSFVRLSTYNQDASHSSVSRPRATGIATGVSRLGMGKGANGTTHGLKSDHGLVSTGGVHVQMDTFVSHYDTVRPEPNVATVTFASNNRHNGDIESNFNEKALADSDTEDEKPRRQPPRGYGRDI